MIAILPPNDEIETKKILKLLPSVHAALAELKATAQLIPNQNILLNTLALQEAKDSSAIENIITTHDELYKSELNLSNFNSLNAKEVQNYVAALKIGFDSVKNSNMITNSTILNIQEAVENNKAGFRKLPGTTLKNEATGEIIYTPPQNHNDIIRFMDNLVLFINDDTLCECDFLVKLALIHHQFESIHPFYDGNGRTGRIINILYLILKGLQNVPILYLSSYIIKNKSDYYNLLQVVRESNNWEDWIIFILKGIKDTATDTIKIINQISKLMQDYKRELKTNFKFYSHELINNLFKHPYTKIEFLEKDLSVSRITAANYLNQIAEKGLLKKAKIGVSNYYINERLINILVDR